MDIHWCHLYLLSTRRIISKLKKDKQNSGGTRNISITSALVSKKNFIAQEKVSTGHGKKRKVVLGGYDQFWMAFKNTKMKDLRWFHQGAHTGSWCYLWYHIVAILPEGKKMSVVRPGTKLDCPCIWVFIVMNSFAEWSVKILGGWLERWVFRKNTRWSCRRFIE